MKTDYTFHSALQLILAFSLLERRLNACID